MVWRFGLDFPSSDVMFWMDLSCLSILAARATGSPRPDHRAPSANLYQASVASSVGLRPSSAASHAEAYPVFPPVRFLSVNSGADLYDRMTSSKPDLDSGFCQTGHPERGEPVLAGGQVIDQTNTCVSCLVRF